VRCPPWVTGSLGPHGWADASRLGVHLQGNTKVVEGRQHEDRTSSSATSTPPSPNTSGPGSRWSGVDTKKKKLVGECKNGGRKYQPAGQPERVRVHDYPVKGPAQGHSPSQRFAAGRKPRIATRPPTGCWSAPTAAGPPETGSGPGRSSSPNSPARPAWRSPSATSRPGPASGSRSNIGCSPRSPCTNPTTPSIPTTRRDDPTSVGQPLATDNSHSDSLWRTQTNAGRSACHRLTRTRGHLGRVSATRSGAVALSTRFSRWARTGRGTSNCRHC
jgi:hypothetical protein